MELLVGSYTSGSNHGAGISSLPIGHDGRLGAARLLAEVADPSFLALADDGVYAVLEQEQGRVAVFSRDGRDGSLALVGLSPVIGADPCHLALLPAGRVIAANYSSGSVSLLAPGAPLDIQHTLQLTGSGPVAERQEGPHAHQTVPTPYGTVLVSDLGSDSVLELRPETDSLREECQLPLPAGAGPRHLVLRRSDSTDQLLVIGELDGMLHTFNRPRREASGGWEYLGQVPLSSTEMSSTEMFRTEGVGGDYPAHLELSADAELAYASIRGQDQISVFRLSALDLSAAENGAALGNAELPELIQETPTGGSWPRHFALGDGVLYAANQKGDSITVFALQPDGLLGERLQDISIGTPVCLVVV